MGNFFLPSFKSYDIFISYVVEDRDYVEELVRDLKALGYKVWYAQKELVAGSDVFHIVNGGLENSRYGVAVISSLYTSRWAYGELFALEKMKGSFIPILHGISIEKVVEVHPSLINIWALNADKGNEYILSEIQKIIRLKSKAYYFIASCIAFFTRKAYLLKLLFILILCGIVSYFIIANYQSKRPASSEITKDLTKRVKEVENLTTLNFQKFIVEENWQKSSLQEVSALLQKHNKENDYKYYQNSVLFTNGIDNIKTISGLKNNGIISASSLLELPYGLENFEIYFNTKTGTSNFTYLIVNTLPLQWEIHDSRIEKESIYEVDVQFSNAIRLIVIDIHYSQLEMKRFRHIELYGVKPIERMIYQKLGGVWSIINIQ